MAAPDQAARAQARVRKGLGIIHRIGKRRRSTGRFQRDQQAATEGDDVCSN